MAELVGPMESIRAGPPDGERRQLPAICRARQRLDRHHDAARRGDL